MSDKKPKPIPNIMRLRATLEAVKGDISHFNQGLWVSAPGSGKLPDTCGGFSWFAVQIYGTEEQKKRFTWDKAHDWVGIKILGLSLKRSQALSWGANTILMIEGMIDKWEAEL